LPFRLEPSYGEYRAKIQFTTAAWMPYQVYQACKATEIPSNTVYCQIAVCEKLARDLDLDLDELLENLPRARTSAAHLWNPNEALPGRPGRHPRAQFERPGSIVRPGMGNTDEEVH
jgi:hypothetical protein